jgi:hypothetical protein
MDGKYAQMMQLCPFQASGFNMQFPIQQNPNGQYQYPIFWPQPVMNGFSFQGKKTAVRRKFSHEEDAALKALVEKNGTGNWGLIAGYLKGRTARQCRERWRNYLAPGISTEPWSPEDDQLLSEKHKELGSQWSKIAKFFPNRTDVNVKNRWTSLDGKANKANQMMDMISDNDMIL